MADHEYGAWSANEHEQIDVPSVDYGAMVGCGTEYFDVVGAAMGWGSGDLPFDLEEMGLDDRIFTDLLRDDELQTRARQDEATAGRDEEPENQCQWEPRLNEVAEAHQGYARPQTEEWDYVVEVWPGIVDDNDEKGLEFLAEHVFKVNEAFENKSLDYHIRIQEPISAEDLALRGLCRRYIVPRQYRDSEHGRHKFFQVFNYERQYNRSLYGYYYKMGVAYDTRSPLPTGAFSPPADVDHRDPKVGGFNPLNPNGDPMLVESSPPTPSTSSLPPTTPPDCRESSPPAPAETKPGVPKISQPRMKPIPKPQRQIVQDGDGNFMCTWEDCTASSKSFARKCEWNKHMDKHERPYKCLATGCENVPGFTYSGGLLRHEREVHNKHGGPKNPLYCPHPGCKRHKDSSFARLENLNEHLRRCHTPGGPHSPSVATQRPRQRSQQQQQQSMNSESDVVGSTSRHRSRTAPIMSPAAETESSPAPMSVISVLESPRIGGKRKAAAEDDDDLSEENKRLRRENGELRRKIEAGYLQQSAMMEQIDTLEKDKATLLDQLKNVDML